jgi:hypothetical protein
MASPAQLVKAVSDATGVPLPTIVDIDRKLVKGDLRTVGGRGFRAAQMTPLDAARLLTAVLASPQANVSVDAVERYAQTRIDKARSSETLFGISNLDELAALPARHSFVDALAALIKSASAGALAKLVAASEDGDTPSIELFAFTRATRARIRIAGLPDGMTASVEYLPAKGGRKSSGAKSGPGRDNAAAHAVGDLEQSRRITERTILPIAALLAKGGSK